MKKMILRLFSVADIILAPLIPFSAWLLKTVRWAGIHRLPFCKMLLFKIGVFPIRDHYHEPQFDIRETKRPFSQERLLPAIDWNISEQLSLLELLTFSAELNDIPIEQTPNDLRFYLNNAFFESGDAEYWYQLIRLKKPRKIYEVGSGHSTLMAIKAIQKNQEENADYKCKHVCIEPYERTWLEKTGVLVVRKKVEDVEVTFFSDLEENDILFIDSSHIIRPEGDVLFEYLELLPTLKIGVICHIHDIFSPRNYLRQWLVDEVRLWNEQYLLEAFLSHNSSWKIIGSLNYLHHNHYRKLKQVAPSLTTDREPGSFYIQRIGLARRCT